MNTIADLVYHVNYYIAGLIRVFEDGPLDIHDKLSFDRPPIEAESDWRRIEHGYYHLGQVSLIRKMM